MEINEGIRNARAVEIERKLSVCGHAGKYSHATSLAITTTAAGITAAPRVASAGISSVAAAVPAVTSGSCIPVPAAA